MEITKKELYTIVFTAIHEISLAPTVKDIVIVSNTIKDELNKLYSAYSNQGMSSSFAGNDYWSSSEYDQNNAWFQSFTTDQGAKAFLTKNYTFYVHCVRPF